MFHPWLILTLTLFIHLKSQVLLHFHFLSPFLFSLNCSEVEVSFTLILVFRLYFPTFPNNIQKMKPGLKIEPKMYNLDIVGYFLGFWCILLKITNLFTDPEKDTKTKHHLKWVNDHLHG